ncbi:hypothetical protein RCG19_17170 [Neobacillus sp. OS1-2]|uniref:hypothetical protein n=1 Tax=Neobacillus sp. OS1-2 TaxID=3070680 RepID=UPI0027E103C1|nr:hypothetical protein [Neobacillus sp. OS1-2]WML38909.1 hypothetical protein RCG19_17170 [Neobacillus sp. OS1-2]
MLNRVAVITYYFLLELISGILFLFLFFINKRELPPLHVLAGLCVGSIIIFSLLLVRYHNRGKWLYFVTVFPTLLVICNHANISLFSGACLGLFVFWRGISLLDDFSLHSETLLLLLSFFFGLVAIIYAAMSHYPYQSEIIYLLIGQLVIVLIGEFVRKWYLVKKDQSKFVFYFLLIIAVITLISISFTTLLKYFQLLFFGILQTILLLLASIAKPLFAILEFLVSLAGNESKPTKMIESSDLQDKSDNYQALSYDTAENILYFILILAAVTFIIYLFYKKKLKPRPVSIDSSFVISVSEGVFGAVHTTLYHRRIKPPEDKIRREIFELEKYAKRLNLGRLSFETLEEWWLRVGLSGSLESLKIYEKVRYGGVPSSLEEQTKMKTEIRCLKQQLKEIKKA